MTTTIIWDMPLQADKEINVPEIVIKGGTLLADRHFSPYRRSGEIVKEQRLRN